MLRCVNRQPGTGSIISTIFSVQKKSFNWMKTAKHDFPEQQKNTNGLEKEEDGRRGNSRHFLSFISIPFTELKHRNVQGFIPC